MSLFGNSDSNPEDNLSDGQIEQNRADIDKEVTEDTEEEDKRKPALEYEPSLPPEELEKIEELEDSFESIEDDMNDFRTENEDLRNQNKQLQEKIDNIMSMYDGFLSNINPAMETMKLSDKSKEEQNRNESDKKPSTDEGVSKDVIRMKWMEDIVSNYSIGTALRVVHYYDKKGDISQNERHKIEGILQLHPSYSDSNTEREEIDELDSQVKDLSEEYVSKLN